LITINRNSRSIGIVGRPNPRRRVPGHLDRQPNQSTTSPAPDNRSTELGAVVDEADELAELLGDLDVLRVAIDAHADATTDHQAEQLRAAIDEAAIGLRHRAVPLGLGLYAERPKCFVARVTAYWEARPAQRAAEAKWIARPTATRVRELLEARSGAAPRDRARIARELRGLGFHVSEATKHVDATAADFDASDFDELIARGTVRVH
jgi:hypothetical protein